MEELFKHYALFLHFFVDFLTIWLIIKSKFNSISILLGRENGVMAAS